MRAHGATPVSGLVARRGVELAEHAIEHRLDEARPAVEVLVERHRRGAEPLAERAQLAGRGRAAVDPAAALALRVERAAQQQFFAFRVEPVAGKPCVAVGRAVERRGDLAARRAFAHEHRVRARTERELQRVDQDRLAGTGLAGQHREAGREFELEFMHDHEVAQADPPQRHA